MTTPKGAGSIVVGADAGENHVAFEKFQAEQLGRRLPAVPLRTTVYGSIFQTAYYFIDLNIGAPVPQSISLIVDTGSSTQGMPCNDCEWCGHGHWESAYDRRKSQFSSRIPCGNCTTCRLHTDRDLLMDLVPPLLPVASQRDVFVAEASHLLLNDPRRMQCLYQVHYAEGSTLAGLFYKDVIWLNTAPFSPAARDGPASVIITAASLPRNSVAEFNVNPDPEKPSKPPDETLQGSATTAPSPLLEPMVCPNFPLQLGPSVPLIVPVGCHMKETHLFYDQKASGILGLEFWGTKGVPTFPTAILTALHNLYQNHDLYDPAQCTLGPGPVILPPSPAAPTAAPKEGEDVREKEEVGLNSADTLSAQIVEAANVPSPVVSPRQELKNAFALCLSPEGGSLSFGQSNREFHLHDRRISVGSPEAVKYASPLISTPTKAQSFLLALTEVGITKINMTIPEHNSKEFLQLLDNTTIWDPISLRPSAILVIDKASPTATNLPTEAPISTSSNSSTSQTSSTKIGEKGSSVKMVPTLLDSGTTLTYFPSRLYQEILDAINMRVAVHVDSQDSQRRVPRYLSRLTPEDLFADSRTRVVVKENIDELHEHAAPDTLEFVPIMRHLPPGPKKLIKLQLAVSALESYNSADDDLVPPTDLAELDMKGAAAPATSVGSGDTSVDVTSAGSDTTISSVGSPASDAWKGAGDEAKEEGGHPQIGTMDGDLMALPFISSTIGSVQPAVGRKASAKPHPPMSSPTTSSISASPSASPLASPSGSRSGSTSGDRALGNCVPNCSGTAVGLGVKGGGSKERRRLKMILREFQKKLVVPSAQQALNATGEGGNLGINHGGRSRRRLSADKLSGWYAVLDPKADLVDDDATFNADGSFPSASSSGLLGFLDIPESMEGAVKRALLEKYDKTNNGECWWLQKPAQELRLFPALRFKFYPKTFDVWHPLSYLYRGTNEHLWCLAMMTDTLATQSLSPAVPAGTGPTGGTGGTGASGGGGAGGGSGNVSDVAVTGAAVGSAIALGAAASPPSDGGTSLGETTLPTSTRVADGEIMDGEVVTDQKVEDHGFHNDDLDEALPMQVRQDGEEDHSAAVDEEVIFGSNSFVHHDIVFDLGKLEAAHDDASQSHGQIGHAFDSQRRRFTPHPVAQALLIPANCPRAKIAGRSHRHLHVPVP